MAKWITDADEKWQRLMIRELMKYQRNALLIKGDQIENVTSADTSKMDYYLHYPYVKNMREISAKNLYPIELRRRELNRSKYYTVFLNKDKWEFGQRIARENGTKFIFVVQWEDGLFAIDETHARIVSDVSEINLSEEKDVRFITMGGRNQMRDDNDVDKPVVNIPVQHFIPVSKFPTIIEE